MKKKLFGGLAVLLLAGLVLAGCTNPTSGGTGNSSRAASSFITQDDRDQAVTLTGHQNLTKKSANGDKITSNAHSADFPGIYFYWDSKQKDDGILKIDAEVFETVGSFVLTVKDADKYYDFDVNLDKGQVKSKDPGTGLTYYTFKIPRATFNDKNININMVYLDNWMDLWHAAYDDAVIPTPVKNVFSFQKVFKDVRGGNATVLDPADLAAITFDIYDNPDTTTATPVITGLHLKDGNYVTWEGDATKVYYVKENLNGLDKRYASTDDGMVVANQAAMQNITVVSGSKTSKVVIDTTTGAKISASDVDTSAAYGSYTHLSDGWVLTGGTADAMQKITNSDGDGAKWIWGISDPNSTELNGQNLIVSETSIDIPAGYSAIQNANFYYACDNAAVIYVDKHFIGYSTDAFAVPPPDLSYPFQFGTVDNSLLNDNDFNHVYCYPIPKDLLTAGSHKIKIYALNSKTDNTQNAAGLIYACSFDVVSNAGNNQFTNVLREYYNTVGKAQVSAHGGSNAMWISSDILANGWSQLFNLTGLDKYSRDPVVRNIINDKTNNPCGTATFSIDPADYKLIVTLQFDDASWSLNYLKLGFNSAYYDNNSMPHQTVSTTGTNDQGTYYTFKFSDSTYGDASYTTGTYHL